MALDKRHPMSTDMNDVPLDSENLMPDEIEAMQDSLDRRKSS